MKAKKYKISYQEDGLLKTSIIECENLENELLPKNIVYIKKLTFDFNLFKTKVIREKDIKNTLYELSIMLNSNILFDDAINILLKKEKNESIKSFLGAVKNSFSNSIDIEKSLDGFKINSLIKSFFKITQNSGNVNSNISSLSKIINENYEIKKDLLKAMSYPIILFVTFILSLIGIFKFVVPNFESILLQSKADISLATKILFFSKNIFEEYSLFILVTFTLITFLILFLYKSNKKVKLSFDEILVNKLFIISDLYRLKVFYTYFVVLDIFLQNRHEFLDSIIKSKVLLNNKYLLDKITQIENLLKSGKSVSFAFESTKLFDDITLNLINTGEVSNSLNSVISEIKNIYKIRFDDKLKLFSILIEPLFFIIIMALIVWIILAVFVPLWSMNDMLKF